MYNSTYNREMLNRLNDMTKREIANYSMLHKMNDVENSLHPVSTFSTQMQGGIANGAYQSIGIGSNAVSKGTNYVRDQGLERLGYGKIEGEFRKDDDEDDSSSSYSDTESSSSSDINTETDTYSDEDKATGAGLLDDITSFIGLGHDEKKEERKIGGDISNDLNNLMSNPYFHTLLSVVESNPELLAAGNKKCKRGGQKGASPEMDLGDALKNINEFQAPFRQTSELGLVQSLGKSIGLGKDKEVKKIMDKIPDKEVIPADKSLMQGSFIMGGRKPNKYIEFIKMKSKELGKNYKDTIKYVKEHNLWKK